MGSQIWTVVSPPAVELGNLFSFNKWRNFAAIKKLVAQKGNNNNHILHYNFIPLGSKRENHFCKNLCFKQLKASSAFTVY